VISWLSWAPSGSGKTTLLNLLGGLDVPSAGSITVDGDEITPHVRGQAYTWRARHVGFIFQMYNLIPVLTAYQTSTSVALLTKLSSLSGVSMSRPRSARHLGDACITTPASFPAGKNSASLSLAPSSRTRLSLLCDEPTGDLDRKSADDNHGP